MSVRDCLSKLVKTGAISAKDAAAARRLWERYQDRFSLDMPPAQAEAAAALQAARVMAQATREKKLSVALQVTRQTAIEREQMAHPWGPAAGGMAALTRDIYRLGGQNVDTRTQTLREILFSKFDAGLEAFKSQMLGLKQDIAGAKQMVGELFGVDTGNAIAKAAAAGWKNATEFGTDYVRRAGKIFEPTEDWRLPQFWNADRVRRFGPEAFVADARKHLEAGGVKLFDKERMEIATDPARIGELLAKAARDIVTEAGSAPAFSNEMRTFLFQDGKAGFDAWIGLQDKYGTGNDILATLRQHLGSMAREAALTDVLGPQHASTVKMLVENARKWEAAGKEGQGGFRPQRWIGLESSKAITRTYDVLSGRANGVDNTFWGGALGSARSMIAASSLGSAVIPAIVGDSVTTLLAARWNGMGFGQVMGRAIETLLAERPELRKEAAARLLVTGHAISDHAVGTVRYADQLVGPDFTRKVADFVIRASGLNAWTEAVKKSFTMEMLGYVARQAAHDRGHVDKPFREFLERNRISATEWEELRARPLQEINGAKFFDSSLAMTDDKVRRLYEGILEERAFAVLEPDARIRSVTTAGAQAGTFVGELARNLTMFQSFSMTMIATHLMAIAARDGSIAGKTLNAVAFFALHTAAGAMIVQARQILQGKDPIDFANPKFWFQATVQGGGLGYYGDLIGGAVQAGDRSLVGKLSGPVGGLIDDTVRFGHAAVSKTYAGQAGSAAGKGVDLLKRITPGQNLWFSRLATDRLIFDQLTRAVDPGYADTFARRENRALEAYGQQSWWRQGELTPQRAPQFGGR